MPPSFPTRRSSDLPLARSSHDRKKMAISSGERGKRAVTHYRLLEALHNAAMVECRLETGRTHQVRVHMASIGHRSEEHTSELQSLMRISYAVFCLKKKKLKT